jgi:hypothetical protein
LDSNISSTAITWYRIAKCYTLPSALLFAFCTVQLNYSTGLNQLDCFIATQKSSSDSLDNNNRYI